MKRLFLLLLISIFASLFLSLEANAQDSLDYRLTVQTSSPLTYDRVYAHHLSLDTLWVTPYFGPVSSTNSLTHYAAEEIVRLRLPEGMKMKSNFGKGAILGFLAGLAVGFLTQPEPCSNSGGVFGSLCNSSRGSHVAGTSLIGLLGGGLIGLASPTERMHYNYIRINGRSERLNAQRAEIERLSSF